MASRARRAAQNSLYWQLGATRSTGMLSSAVDVDVLVQYSLRAALRNLVRV
jgi:hypothetical protein